MSPFYFELYFLLFFQGLTVFCRVDRLSLRQVFNQNYAHMVPKHQCLDFSGWNCGVNFSGRCKNMMPLLRMSFVCKRIMANRSLIYSNNGVWVRFETLWRSALHPIVSVLGSILQTVSGIQRFMCLFRATKISRIVEISQSSSNVNLGSSWTTFSIFPQLKVFLFNPHTRKYGFEFMLDWTSSSFHHHK